MIQHQIPMLDTFPVLHAIWQDRTSQIYNTYNMDLEMFADASTDPEEENPTHVHVHLVIAPMPAEMRQRHVVSVKKNMKAKKSMTTCSTLS
jgi:hypothetical protein